MTLQDDLRELNRSCNEFGVLLALAYLPPMRALSKFTHHRGTDWAEVEKNLRVRLVQLKAERSNG